MLTATVKILSYPNLQLCIVELLVLHGFAFFEFRFVYYRLFPDEGV